MAILNKLKQFIGTSSIYFLGSVLSKVIIFLLLPIYTSKISPNEFGTYDLIVTMISFLAPIAFFQIWDGMYRFSFDKKNNDDKFIYISNSIVVLIIGVFLYSIFFLAFYINYSFDHANLIYIYGIFFALQYQYTFSARVFLENKLFAISGVLNTLLNASVNLILILVFEKGIEALYIASILGIALQIILIEIKIKALKKFSFKSLDQNIQIQMIKFSVPLCFATVTYWLLSGYTKIGISRDLGLEMNGLYAIASKFTGLIALFVSVFQFAWNELAYLISKESNRKKQYEISLNYMTKVVLISAAIIMLVTKLIFPVVVNYSYNGALLLIPIAIMGVAFNSLAGFIGTIFMTEKNTKVIFWTTMFAASINVISLSKFTEKFGIQGAIASLSISFLSLFFIRIYLASKFYNVKISFYSILKLFILMIATAFIFFTIENIAIVIIAIILLIIIFIYSIKDLIIILLNRIKYKKLVE